MTWKLCPDCGTRTVSPDTGRCCLCRQAPDEVQTVQEMLAAIDEREGEVLFYE
jgi:hypothetical protein